MVRFVQQFLQKAKAGLNIKTSNAVKRIGGKKREEEEEEGAEEEHHGEEERKNMYPRDSILTKEEGDEGMGSRRGKGPVYPPGGRPPLRARKAWAIQSPVSEDPEATKFFHNVVAPEEEELRESLSNAFIVKSMRSPSDKKEEKEVKPPAPAPKKSNPKQGKQRKATEKKSEKQKHGLNKKTDHKSRIGGSKNTRPSPYMKETTIPGTSDVQNSPRPVVEINRDPGAFKITIDLRALTDNPESHMDTQDAQGAVAEDRVTGGLSRPYSREGFSRQRSPSLNVKAAARRQGPADLNNSPDPLHQNRSPKAHGYPDYVKRSQLTNNSETGERSSLQSDKGGNNTPRGIRPGQGCAMKMGLGIKCSECRAGEERGQSCPLDTEGGYGAGSYVPTWQGGGTKEKEDEGWEEDPSSESLRTLKDIVTNHTGPGIGRLRSARQRSGAFRSRLHLTKLDRIVEHVGDEGSPQGDGAEGGGKSDKMHAGGGTLGVDHEEVTPKGKSVENKAVQGVVSQTSGTRGTQKRLSVIGERTPRSTAEQGSSTTRNSRPRVKSAGGSRGVMSSRPSPNPKSNDWNFKLAEILPKRSTFSSHEKALKQGGYNIRALERARRRSVSSTRRRKPCKKKTKIKTKRKYADGHDYVSRDPSETIETQMETLSRTSDASSKESSAPKQSRRGTKALGDAATTTGLALRFKSMAKKQQEMDEYDQKSVHVNPKKLIQYLKMVRDHPEEYRVLLHGGAAKVASDQGKVHVQGLVGLGKAYRRGHHNFGNPESLVISAAYELGSKQPHPCCSKYDQAEKAKASGGKTSKRQGAAAAKAKSAPADPAAAASSTPAAPGASGPAAEEEVGLSELEKCRAEVERWLATLTTVQTVKARDLALRELGEDNRSIRKWWVAQKYCRYLRRPAAIDDYYIY